jgi:hypothetical protein
MNRAVTQPGPPAVATVYRRLRAAKLPRARLDRIIGWTGGVCVGDVGGAVLVHYFGSPAERARVLSLARDVLDVLGYRVEWIRNAAGDPALAVTEGGAR